MYSISKGGRYSITSLIRVPLYWKSKGQIRGKGKIDWLYVYKRVLWDIKFDFSDALKTLFKKKKRKENKPDSYDKGFIKSAH